jgi:flagellar FliL protein
MAKKLKPIIMIVGGLAVVAVLVMFVLPKVTGGAVQIQIGGGAKAAATVSPTATPEADGPPRGVPVTLGERVVNLADPGGFRYIKTEIVLSLAEPGVDVSKLSAAKMTEETNKLDAELTPIKPEIQDTITSVLTSKTVADVSTTDGKDAIKAELMDKLAPLLDNVQIVAVYFAQFLIQ